MILPMADAGDMWRRKRRRPGRRARLGPCQVRRAGNRQRAAQRAPMRHSRPCTREREAGFGGTDSPRPPRPCPTCVAGVSLCHRFTVRSVGRSSPAAVPRCDVARRAPCLCSRTAARPVSSDAARQAAAGWHPWIVARLAATRRAVLRADRPIANRRSMTLAVRHSLAAAVTWRMPGAVQRSAASHAWVASGLLFSGTPTRVCQRGSGGSWAAGSTRVSARASRI